MTNKTELADLCADEAIRVALDDLPRPYGIDFLEDWRDKKGMDFWQEVLDEVRDDCG